jgi:hypothetical protein
MLAFVVGSVSVLGSAPASVHAAEPVTGTGRISANSVLGGTPVGAGRAVPGLATDPADGNHVVEVDEDFTRGQCTFRTTHDGGKSWAGGDLSVPPGLDPVDGPGVPPCDAVDSGGFAHFDQSVAFGSGANVYATFSSGNAVVVSHSPDGGTSFGPGVVAVAAPPVSGAFDIRPQLAVEPGAAGDRIYVSALNRAGSPGGGERLVTTRSDDGGVTWSPVVDAQGEGETVREPAQPVVGADGAVVVAWHGGTGASADQVVVARSTDRGATWARSPAAGVPGGGGFPYLAVGPSAPQGGPAKPGQGTLRLVYVGGQDNTTDISMRRSDDNGATWSAPVRVSDDAPTQPGAATVQHLRPRLSSSADGRIDVVWTDTRAGYEGPIGFGDIWYSASIDGGGTFSTNRRVNDRTIDLGSGQVSESALADHGPVVTALGGGRLLFAWGDSRDGGVGTGVDTDSHAGSDVFMAVMDPGATGPVPSTALDDNAPEQLSVDLSRLAFPGGTANAGSQRTTGVVLVNSTDDTGLALAAAVLARANNSPLLLAAATDLTPAQKKEVARLAPGGAYLVGAATRLSDKVEASLAAAGATDTQRITGSDSTDTARRIAALLDTRDAEARASGVPAFQAAVVVNSQTGDAATGSALAAALRMPVLFTQRDAIPPATTQALAELGIRTTLVVGGPASVANAVLRDLPGGRRLGGDDPTVTSEAVAAEARARNVATNVVYVSDGERPSDQAAIGAAVASLGGIMLAEPTADPAAARRSLDALGITPVVDRLVSVRSDTSGASTGVRMALAVVILLIGIATLVVALAHRDRDTERAATPGEK